MCDESRLTNQMCTRVRQAGWCRPDIFAIFAFASSAEASTQHQEHQQQQQQQQQQPEERRERRMPLTSTPLKMASLHAPSALKGKISASGTVTMPFFGTSPEPEELTENSWLRGSTSNHNGSRSSLSNQVCARLLTTKIAQEWKFLCTDWVNP